MRTSLSALAPLLLLLFACGADAPVARVQPNILLVIGDDHGYRDFGFMGSQHAQTPTLDRLAGEGTVFTHGYSAASACRPSLAAILTGLYPIQWHAHTTELALREKDSNLAKRRIMATVNTLPRLLGQHGYASFQTGKYWEGDPTAAGFSEGMGYDTSIGRRTLEPVFDFLDRNRDQPFFLWYAPMLPHIPRDAPDRFARLYSDGELDPRVQRYLANVAWFDDGLGQIVDRLESLGVRDRTLIVYLADNGWQAVGEPSERGGDLSGFLGGRKGKGSLYELGFRTPIVFHWPGQVPTGTRSDALVSAVDLLPTLLDYANVSVENRPGKSLRPLIDGREPQVRERLIGSQGAGRREFFVRDRRWHYLKFRDRPAELYDVLRDPDEERDVAARHPRVTAGFDTLIGDWVRQVLGRRIDDHPLPPADLPPG